MLVADSMASVESGRATARSAAGFSGTVEETLAPVKPFPPERMRIVQTGYDKRDLLKKVVSRAEASQALAQAASSMAVPPEAETCRGRARVPVLAPAAARSADLAADRLLRLPQRSTSLHSSSPTSHHTIDRTSMCYLLPPRPFWSRGLRSGLSVLVFRGGFWCCCPPGFFFAFSSASRGSCGFDIGIAPEVLGSCRNSAAREIVPTRRRQAFNAPESFSRVASSASLRHTAEAEEAVHFGGARVTFGYSGEPRLKGRSIGPCVGVHKLGYGCQCGADCS